MHFKYVDILGGGGPKTGGKTQIMEPHPRKDL